MKFAERKFCQYCGAQLTTFTDHEGKSRRRCSKCGAVIYENPIPATALIVPHPDDEHRIVLVKRAVEPCRGQYSLPGGFMEINETPEECAVREMREETGLIGKVKKMLGVRNQPSPQYKMVMLVGYEMEIIGGKLGASDDAEEADFFNIDNHPKIAFEAHLWFVERYQSKICD